MYRLPTCSNIKSKCNNFKCGYQGRNSYIQGCTFSQFSICLGPFSAHIQVLLTLSLLITVQSKFLWRYAVLYVLLKSSVENSVRHKCQDLGLHFSLLRSPIISFLFGESSAVLHQLYAEGFSFQRTLCSRATKRYGQILLK